ncbi:MAG TPA: ABC transporter permease [Myxococcota bacterium]|nr:ABC transporter permease [Myxococcota bacterium]
MFGYALRKVLLSIPLVLGVITLIFVLVELSPGDATDRFFTPETPPEVRQLIEKKWGLDRPAHERYVILMRNLTIPTVFCGENPWSAEDELPWYACPAGPLEEDASGYDRIGRPTAGLDFGRSIFQERPVFDIVMEALPNTIQLALMSIIIMQLVGVTLGSIQAVRQYGWSDSGISIASLFFYSMPSFWLALMLQLILTLKFPILPTSGMVDAVMYDYMSPGEQILDRMKHLILPGVALSIARAAGIARYMRSSLLEVIRQDYIRTARAKGLPEWKVIVKHGMRNALLPIITILGLQLPFLFSGSVLVETIFAWPGMGRLIVSAIFTQDTPVIIGCFFVFTLLVVAGNLIADLLYSVVDPRIRYS